ncbi:D-arabinono-1,4-lactone oxidase [Homoserinimonas sp. OAct 916]|uniref:D-arabinono-1,4-lactone oxidase n=1 Tax=Homoserinimonas sp. OAct 916 TaxID=2211450 RepID=UPI001E3F2399|nr:D-arabinono-1,4-lactone oxidase [Homoserinimonas sp. OAct 916]
MTVSERNEKTGSTLISGTVWRNWARTVEVRPTLVARPTSVAGVQRAIETARARGITVKAVGAGHSFTAIAEAPGVQLDLTRLTGLIDVDQARRRVRLLAGTCLRDIPELLAPYALAMENLGDIDSQSISGAISTGTHGTGASFGGIATQVVAALVVTASGDLLRIDENQNSELLPALSLGLGALGILVEVTLQCVPQFVLQAVEQPERLDAVLESVLERAAAVDHFEFYWFPHTKTALTKSNTRLPADAHREPLTVTKAYLDDVVVANGVFRLTCNLGRIAPAAIPGINRMAEKLTGNRRFTDLSTNVFITRRTVRFKEMEYAIPAEHVVSALREINAVIQRRGLRISFPLEVRFAKEDSLWLSTASGRATVYIAAHRFFREDHREYFAALEEVLRSFGGRPHWGKMHTQDAESLRQVYPHFDNFIELRDRLDPERLFANRYLDRVLGA